MSPAQALIGFGSVYHRRLRPRQHAFLYPTCFLVLPLRSMAAHGDGDLPRNRWAPMSFHDADHGDGRGPQAGGALAWMDALLRQHGINDATGECWLHTYPRVWGYSFKPVSFWFCHNRQGHLRAFVAEVNNTFGERHCYLIENPQPGLAHRVHKAFHVSPFCPVAGQYQFRWRFDPTQAPTQVRVDYDDGSGPLLRTMVQGRCVALNAQTLRQALWAHPWLTLGVIARIHWQAARLFVGRKAPLFRKPPPPLDFLTQSQAKLP